MHQNKILRVFAGNNHETYAPKVTINDHQLHHNDGCVIVSVSICRETRS